MELRLNSLCGYNPLIYRWPYDFKEQGCEIIETINLACQEEPPLQKHLNDILANCVTNSYESMKMVCQSFNQAVDNLRSLIKSGLYHPQPRASVELLHHILQICYNRAVIDPDKLNHYEPFSAEVYGETSFELVHQMIQTIRFTESDRFIDLGSGVGHVVLQVAAATPCKSCYGIEKAHWPALYAQQMSSEFEKWMKFYGKDYGAFDLLKGNFLSDDFKDVISNATVIFVNNFAFGPQVDHELKLKFSNLKEGTKIVSSKAFCAMNMQISERNLSDIGAILTVEELSPLRGPVSWTPKRVTYYLHTIDRTQLEEYFRRKQNPLLKKSASRKSITLGTPKMTKQSVSSAQVKGKSVKSKLWKKKSLQTKRPSAISMLSTITADASPRMFNSSNHKFHDSLNTSESPLPCYVFPSAQALTFDDSQSQMFNQAEALRNVDHVTKATPTRYQFLPSKAARKLTEKSPFGSPSCDILFGFGINENEISGELLAEIDNIINLFHDETVRVTYDEDYKSKEIFNDSLLLKSFYDMKTRNGLNEMKNNHFSLSSLANDEPSKLLCSLTPSNDNDQSQPTSRKTCTYSPSIKTKKISVSLPRLSSPITPATPTTSFDKNHCIKKCIPFSKPEKQVSLKTTPVLDLLSDGNSSKVNVFLQNQSAKLTNLSLELPSCNTMIVGPLKQESRESVISKNVSGSSKPALQTFQPPLKLTIQCQNDRYKSSTSVKPSKCYTTSITALGSSQQIAPEKPTRPLASASVSNECRPPFFTSRTSNTVDFSVPVSFPRQILDNSQHSADDSSRLSTSTLTPSCENGIAHDSGDDDDPPEMSALLDKFRLQYRHMIKVMKSPKFKMRFTDALNYEKIRQETLRHQVHQLNRELQELQIQNDILLHKLMSRNPEPAIDSTTFRSSMLHRDASFVTPESPNLLNRALFLDVESTSCRDEPRPITADSSSFPPKRMSDNFDENDEEVSILCNRNPSGGDRVPSPDIEMPLLLPEPTSLQANARSSEPDVEDRSARSTFCPPPRLTVCVDGINKKDVLAEFDAVDGSADLVYNDSSNKTSSHSQLSLLSSYPTDKPSTAGTMCFSPISSCGSESPIPVAKAPDLDIGSKELFLEEESFKSYQRSHFACVSSLSSSVYYSALSNALQDCYYSRSFCEASNLQKGSSSEESGPCLTNRKRKSSDSCESLSRSKRMPNQTEFLVNIAECFGPNSIASKNLLHTKCLTDPSSVDSRSDSRDSGYGKDSETDNETTNKLGQSRGAALGGPRTNIKHPYNVEQPQRRHLGLLMIEDTTLTNSANSFNSKENCYQSPLAHKSRNSHLCNYENAFQPMPAITNWSHCNNSTLVDNQLPQQFGSFELSFASLASYYEKCLANGNGVISPSSFRNPQNYLSQKKHKFSTDFT